MSKDYFLITTAEKASWDYDSPVLFLGEWCKTYNNKSDWETINAKVATYHWDDRKKAFNDYKYLRNIYEKLLVDLSNALNTIHRTSYSLRYWRILIGPWLLYFTEILFDRWETIHSTNSKYKISKTIVIDFRKELVIPKGMEDFRKMYLTDIWNHTIYSTIIQNSTSLNYRIVQQEKVKNFSKSKTSINSTLFKKFKIYLNKYFSIILNKFSKKSDAVLVESYLNFKTKLLLQLLFKQVPVFRNKKDIPSVNADLKFRKSITSLCSNHKGFEKFIRSIIFDNIPTIYLEGYNELLSTVRNINWPVQPKFIFTSGAYNMDDVFKAWAARCVEDGYPLIIGQHGGNLGSALWTSSEDHEVAISDRYITWGWTNGSSKHYPFGIIKNVNESNWKYNSSGKLLMINYVMPKYSYVMGSFPVGSHQTKICINDQFKFVSNLNKIVFKNIVTRVFNPDWDWEQVKRWNNKFPRLKIDLGNESLKKSIQKSRLVIISSNGTVLLETLSMNIPTIIFWDPNLNEIRPSAEKYFNKLFEAGILFYNPEDASKKVNEIWNNIDEWWYSNKTQEARKIFCSKFANYPKKSLKKLKESLTL